MPDADPSQHDASPLRLPPRPPASHKGSFGAVLVVGGSEGMIGAPALAARAAIRAGAGWVRLLMPKNLLPHGLVLEPTATGAPLDEAGQWDEAVEAADPGGRGVLAIGPGLGGRDVVWPTVARGLADPRPLVLDADGLNALARASTQDRRSAMASHRRSDAEPIILTPHPGEFRRLAEAFAVDPALDATDHAHRPAAAEALSDAAGAIVVLKGARTVVAAPARSGRDRAAATWINRTGNPALAVAGSGDVLTGVIASLWGQLRLRAADDADAGPAARDRTAFHAAATGVALHGLAADRWARRHGPAGLRPTDLADELPTARHAMANLLR